MREEKNVKNAGKPVKKDIGKIVQKILDTAFRVLLVLLAAAGIIVLLRSFFNKVFLLNYEGENYSEFPENLTLAAPVGENYVAPYNMGNIKYRKGEYEEAVRYYYKALQSNPPAEEKECCVRINLALACLHTFDFDGLDTSDSEKVDAALDVLYTARFFLTENGCASEAFMEEGGHSEEAERLKRDIDEMIRKLSDSSENRSNSENDESESEDDSSGGEDQQNENAEQQEQDASKSEQEQKEEQEKQKSLQEQLKEQKEDLQEGTYSSGRSSDYNYVESDGELYGFGEGTPW